MARLAIMSIPTKTIFKATKTLLSWERDRKALRASPTPVSCSTGTSLSIIEENMFSFCLAKSRRFSTGCCSESRSLLRLLDQLLSRLNQSENVLAMGLKTDLATLSATYLVTSTISLVTSLVVAAIFNTLASKSSLDNPVT